MFLVKTDTLDIFQLQISRASSREKVINDVMDFDRRTIFECLAGNPMTLTIANRLTSGTVKPSHYSVS